jgi:hypothetical protein
MVKAGTHKLNGARECRDAIADAQTKDPLSITRGSKGLRFLDAQGRLLGSLSARHELAVRLEAGEHVLHCSAMSVYGRCDMRPDGMISVHVATGSKAESYERWGGPEPRASRAYPVNIVGESHYQDAIRATWEGDPVVLYRESGNPHDPRAIVAKTAAGLTIGYLPRDSWLQRVVHDEGDGATATIMSLHPGPPVAVVLEVAVIGTPLDVAHYAPAPATPRAGWLGKLFGG